MGSSPLCLRVIVNMGCVNMGYQWECICIDIGTFEMYLSIFNKYLDYDLLNFQHVEIIHIILNSIQVNTNILKSIATCVKSLLR